MMLKEQSGHEYLHSENESTVSMSGYATLLHQGLHFDYKGPTELSFVGSAATAGS